MNKSLMKKISIIMVIICLSLVCIATWFFKGNYLKGAQDAKEIDTLTNEIEWQIIKSIIQEDYLSAKDQAYTTAEHITSELLKSYNNLNELENDFNKIEIYHQEKYSLLLDILNSNTKNKYFHKILNYNNNLIICIDSGIILGLHGNFYKNIYPYEWKYIISDSINKKLTENAINNLLNRRNEITYWELDYNLNKGDIPVIDDYPSFTSIQKLYKEYGLEGLKYIQFLAPAYITENGDIFGNDAFDINGNISKYTIIVVQTFNPYDQISKRHEAEILRIRHIKEKIMSAYNFNMLQYSFAMIIIIILTISIIYLLIRGINNVKIKEEEK